MTEKIYLIITISDFYFSTDSKIEVWRWSTALNESFTEYFYTLKERGYNVRLILIDPMEQPNIKDITDIM